MAKERVKNWDGPPHTFSTGRFPKNCWRHPKSTVWYYEFWIKGVKDSGPTGFEDARRAEEYVEARRTAARAGISQDEQSPVERAGITAGRNAKPEILFSEAMATVIEEDKLTGKALTRSLYESTRLVRGIGDKWFHELNHADFYNYRRARLKEKTKFGGLIKPTTINREIAMARRTFNYARNAGYRMPEADDLPNWPELFDSQAEKINARTRELAVHEEIALFDKLREIRQDLVAVAEFALLCGQRRSAVITLKHKNIDWVNNQFTILLKTRGERKRPHVVPLSPRMVEIIKAQPSVGEETNPEGRVFTYECRKGTTAYKDKRGRTYSAKKKGERYPFSEEGWLKDWRAAVRGAGIEDFKFHDMRHTTATRVVRKTGNLNTAKRLLGHEDIKTTQRYAHADTKDVLDALTATENDSDVKRRTVQAEQRRQKFRVVAAA